MWLFGEMHPDVEVLTQRALEQLLVGAAIVLLSGAGQCTLSVFERGLFFKPRTPWPPVALGLGHRLIHPNGQGSNVPVGDSDRQLKGCV